jgi:2-polyprenyl-6-methoxyphenol hydroxylase-like FAD-dependent oxidoreductase
MKGAKRGAGIAGPTLAYWLPRQGHAVTLIEAECSPRPGGYMIDVWAFGFDVAERKGLLPAIRST